MSAFIHYLLMTSAQASVVIIAILSSWRWLSPRVSAKWLYGFWVVAIMRLLIPGVMPGGLPVGSLALVPASTEIVSGPMTSEGHLNVADDPQAAPPGEPERVATAPIHAAGTPASTKAPRFTSGWPLLLQGVWLSGVLLGAGWMLRQHVRLRRMVRHGSVVTEVRVTMLVEDCKELMGVGRKVGIIETTEVQGPALVGIWRPQILLPSGMIGHVSTSELRHVILHELAHLRRWDLAMNWLAAWASILHWFNPLVRLACSQMRRQQEIACDEKVLASLPPHEWHQYGHTLVNLSGSFTSQSALGQVGILENNEQLEQRITMISNHHLPIPCNWIAPVILLGLSTVSILHSSAADNPPTPASTGGGQVSETAARGMGADVSVVAGKDGQNYYHLRYLLTPENCELSIPNEQRPPRYSDSNAYKFEQGGQFEVFIRATAFPVPVDTPDQKPGFMILRMPYTSPDSSDAAGKIAHKRSLFDRIQRMKTEGKGSVEVVIELDRVVRVAEDPLVVRMKGINVFFRQAFGRYIDYTGSLKKEDRVE